MCRRHPDGRTGSGVWLARAAFGGRPAGGGLAMALEKTVQVEILTPSAQQPEGRRRQSGALFGRLLMVVAWSAAAASAAGRGGDVRG